MTMSTIGDVAVTVAVQRSSRMSAISPKKSPAPSFATRVPPRVTSAVPDSITKNLSPRSPSRASTVPAATLSSSVWWASAAKSCSDMELKNGRSFNRA